MRTGGCHIPALRDGASNRHIFFETNDLRCSRPQCAMRGTGAFWIDTVTGVERALRPLAPTTLTVYSLIPFSAAGSVKFGSVSPEATVWISPPWTRSTV